MPNSTSSRNIRPTLAHYVVHLVQQDAKRQGINNAAMLASIVVNHYVQSGLYNPDEHADLTKEQIKDLER